MKAACCQTRLRRALERSADAAGVDLSIVHADSVGWASATFVGARHELCLTIGASDAADIWIADLPEADLTLSGHLVADLRIVGVARDAAGSRVTIEVLTVLET